MTSIARGRMVLPSVTVVAPCRNEARFIESFLQSLVANDYPRDRFEVLILDGMSTDGTREVLSRYARTHAFIRILDNPKLTIPAAMNLGIAQSRGEILLKMDVHALYPVDYVFRCVEALMAFDADCVGGVWRPIPSAETAIGRAIADALSHVFGSGSAYAKVGSPTPRWVDTVALGCYRRSVFDRVGGYNEALAGSSDLDLNTRLGGVGGKILLLPEIAPRYFADGDIRSFWRHNLADGVWSTYVLKFRSKAWRWRHWTPMTFVVALMAGVLLGVAWGSWAGLALLIGLYAFANALASIHLALKRHLPSHLWAVPIVFAVRHLAHGLGSVYGLYLAIRSGGRWRGRRAEPA